jgi:hypothetical protein
MKIHQTKKVLVALCAAMGLGGCGSLDIGDLNNPSIEYIQETPTRSTVLTASTGLIMGHRVGVAVQNGYVAILGVIGREAFIFDGSEPRPVTELLGPTLDPGGPAFGGNFWAAPYANIRNANTVLNALDKVAGMTDAEKEAIRGFAKTMQALDFLVIINTRDTHGAPIDVNRPRSELAPIASKDEVFARIAQLLDEAEGHLKAGGDSFPFALSSGFEGFDTPETFLKFNRAVRARVSVYRGEYALALENLQASFLDTSKSLELGVYHTFGTGSGELGNLLGSPTIYAHPSIVTDADKKANAEVDERVSRKTKASDKVGKGGDGKLTSELVFKMYSSTAPVPIIRNEELILLRAEAHIGLQDNLDEAIADINFIRESSGGLPAREDLTPDNILDELLKQKRYSLLFEGGHRWLDLRRYGKLETLPKEYGDYPVHERFPIPQTEMDARQ